MDQPAIPPAALTPDKDAPPRYRIGIDLGGSKIEAVRLAPDGRLEYRDRVPTPRKTDDEYSAILTTVADFTESILRDTPDHHQPPTIAP